MNPTLYRFPPLLEGTLLKRYKRFLADIELKDHGIVTAHCPNPGSMMCLAEPGTPVWVSHLASPKAKLKFRWELAQHNHHWVCINTHRANDIVRTLLIQQALPWHTLSFRQEVKYGAHSRIDFLVETEKGTLYLEVKSATLSRKPQHLEFPDSITARGQKHLEELTKIVKNGGGQACCLYIACHGEAENFNIASDIDPTYATTFKQALHQGVESYICFFYIDSMGMTLKKIDTYQSFLNTF